MSTIFDAIKKKRDEEDAPSAETAGPRLVRIEVPKDHSTRNLFLAVALGAIVLTGSVIGGYVLLGRLGAFDRPPTDSSAPVEQPPTAVVPESTSPPSTAVEPATTDESTPPEAPALPVLQGIFPDRVNPIAVLNGRRVKLGGVIDGYTLVAVEADHVVVERDGVRQTIFLQ